MPPAWCSCLGSPPNATAAVQKPQQPAALSQDKLAVANAQGKEEPPLAPRDVVLEEPEPARKGVTILEHRPSSVTRDVVLLSICYCLGMGALFSSVSVVSLVVAERVSPSLALVPPGLQKMVQTFAAYKNKHGFGCAALVGALGYAVAAAAVTFIDDSSLSFVVLCIGYCISGLSDPFVQFLRFAAADISPVAFKPRAISYVLAGGSLAAFLGPELASILVDTVPGRRYAGSYLGASALLLLQVFVVLFVDFSPSTVVTRVPDVVESADPGANKEQQHSRDLLAIVCRPVFLLIASTSAVAQLTMISPMQICPLAMEDTGFELRHSSRVIQAHILGMYIPSFFTGNIINKIGKYNLMIVGIFVNLVAECCLLLDPSAFWGYMISLTIVGVGWNWAFVSASSLLSEHVQEFSKRERAKAEGFNDMCIQVLGAVGTAATGFAVGGLGWEALVLMNVALLALQFLSLASCKICCRSSTQA